MKRYLVIVEKGQESFGAYAPDVPGCVSVGNSVEEVLRLIQEALELHLEAMAQDGEAIPEPTYVESHFVEVKLPATIPARI